MCKSTSFNRTIASVLFLFFLVLGCEEAAPPQTKPVVVKKRISQQSQPATAEKEATPGVKEEVPHPHVTPVKKAADTSPSSQKAVSSKVQTPSDSSKAVGEKLPAETKPELSLSEKIADASPRYDPEGKVDPFEPLFKEKPVIMASTKKKYDRRKPLTPLEKIDLSQLKLVGVIRAQSGNRAMVEDATGKGYVVTKGTYVGIHGGRVVEIAKDRAFIEEKVEDIFGKITVSRKELKLQKPAGEE